jgi:hypothetical protein
MADASLALAERRADDLKQAAERLGVEPPTGRQLFGLKAMGLIAPPASAGVLLRVRGIMIVILLIVGLLAVGFGIVELVSLPFGGASWQLAIFYGFILVVLVIGGLAYFGRRRQRKAQGERAEQNAPRAR